MTLLTSTLTSTYSEDCHLIREVRASAGDGGSARGPISEPPALAEVGRREPAFRNREQEIENVLRGVTEEDGTRYWLVVAPPQLGKSWFLRRIGHDVGIDWIVRFCDVRASDSALPWSADALLRRLFDAEVRRDSPLDAGQIAGALLSKRRRMLLLVDSAEHLDHATVVSLRLRLGEIAARLDQAKSTHSRLAVVVASRDDKSWSGMAPGAALRVQSLALSEFKIGVVFAELRKLSEELGCDYSDDQLGVYADLVHSFSEGLPALLRDYVNWLRNTYFEHLEPATVQQYFDGLAARYINDDLMSASSLLGCGPADLAARPVIEQAIRVLSPYRLITRSHVIHHAQAGALSSDLQGTGLSAEQLWRALAGVALLRRPDDEPWRVLYRPIRRLLYRHWYPAEAERVLAHAEACEFLRSFIDVSGRDQIAFLLERLWHELQSLALTHSLDFGEAAIEIAASLADTIRASSVGEPDDLREIFANRIGEDYEIMKVIARYDGLPERLVEAVRNSRLGAGS